MTTKKDEAEMQQSIDEAENNIHDEHALTVAPRGAVATPFKGIDIEGLESVSMSMVAVPYVRLIQPTSKKTENDKGKEAMAGNFLFSDTQREVGELNFVLLRAKQQVKAVDENGQFVADDSPDRVGGKQQLSVLGYDPTDEKLFILSLSVTSFSGFGKLIAKFKSMKLDKTWRFHITGTSTKVENAKGKFYVADFKIGKEIVGEELETITKIARDYGVILDKQMTEEEI